MKDWTEYNRRRRANPEYRAKESLLNTARSMKYRTDLLNSLGGKCIQCGFSDMRALQLDHINGGGGKELRAFKNQYRMYRFYTEHPDIAKEKVQVLCANCNTIKKIEAHECKGVVGKRIHPRS